MQNNCKVTAKPKNVKEFFRTWYFWKPFLGIVAGLCAGFAYFYFVECNTVPCVFNSDAYSSILFGGFLGYFITGSPCSRCS